MESTRRRHNSPILFVFLGCAARPLFAAAPRPLPPIAFQPSSHIELRGEIQARVAELHAALSNPVARPSLQMMLPRSPSDAAGAHVLALLAEPPADRLNHQKMMLRVFGEKTTFELTTILTRIHRHPELASDLLHLRDGLDLREHRDATILAGRMLTLFDGMTAPAAPSPVYSGERRNGWTVRLNPVHDRYRRRIERIPGVAEARAGIFGVFGRSEQELGIRVELKSFGDLSFVISALRRDSGFGTYYDKIGIPIALYFKGEQLYALDGLGKVYEPYVAEGIVRPAIAIPAPNRPNEAEIRDSRNDLLQQARALSEVDRVEAGHFRQPAGSSNPLELRIHLHAGAGHYYLTRLLRRHLLVPVEILREGWILYWQDGNGYVYDPPIRDGKPDADASHPTMVRSIPGDID